MSRSYLIDTNVLLWSWHEPHRLPRRLYELLQEDDKLFFVSLISIWEIHIKVSIGKLVTVENVGESVRRMGYATVPLLKRTSMRFSISPFIIGIRTTGS